MTAFTAEMRTVYFARPLGQDEPIKIGCTCAVERRLQQLRPVAHGEMELLAAVPGSMDHERRIQSLVWHDRVQGEWFKSSTVLRLIIDAAARGELDIDALPPARIRRMPEIAEAKARGKARAEARANG